MVALTSSSGGASPAPPRPLHPLPPDINTFKTLVASTQKVQSNPQSKFVKKMDDIPKVQVHADSSLPLALKIMDHGMVG